LEKRGKLLILLRTRQKDRNI